MSYLNFIFLPQRTIAQAQTHTTSAFMLLAGPWLAGLLVEYLIQRSRFGDDERKSKLVVDMGIKICLNPRALLARTIRNTICRSPSMEYVTFCRITAGRYCAIYGGSKVQRRTNVASYRCAGALCRSVLYFHRLSSRLVHISHNNRQLEDW